MRASQLYTNTCVNVSEKSEMTVCWGVYDIRIYVCFFPSRTLSILYYCLYLCTYVNCATLLTFCWMLFALRISSLLFFLLRSQQSVRSRCSNERPSTKRNEIEKTHTFISDSKRTEWLWLNLVKYYKTERNGREQSRAE